MEKLAKQNVQKSFRKKHVFPMSHNVTTSFQLGEVTPITAICNPAGEATININPTNNSIIRFEPLSKPVFGACKLKTWTQYVPFKDVFKFFPEFLAGTKVNPERGSNVSAINVSSLPTISSDFLMLLVLSESRLVRFKRAGNDDTTKKFVVDNANLTLDATFFQWLFPNMTPAFATNYVTRSTFQPTIADATHLWNLGQGDIELPIVITTAGVEADYIVSFRIHPSRRRLLKVLNSLGYKLTQHRDFNYNLLPLLAVYRSYFDLFHLPQFEDWESTDCDHIIKGIYAYPNAYQFHLGSPVNSDLDYLFGFSLDLTQMFYVEDKNFVSSHVENVFGNSNSLLPNYNGTLHPVHDNPATNDLDSTFRTQAVGNLVKQFSPDAGTSPDGNWLTQHNLDLLKRLFYTANRRSVIGNDTRRLLDVLGYSDWCDQTESTFVGATDDILQVSEIDNAIENPSEGVALGATAGKSTTYLNNGNLTYHAKESGLLIVFGAVVPESGFVNQSLSYLTCCSGKDWYSPEYDGFGFESSPRAIIGLQPRIGHIAGQTALNSDFGRIPRYSGFKVHGNVLNGVFSLPHIMDLYSGYHFDRLIFERSPEFSGDLLNGFSTTLKFSADSGGLAPNASPEWRFPTKYRWLGNFERVFSDTGMARPYNADDEYFYNYDKVYGHFAISATLDAAMLPIEDTWETIEGEQDGKDVTSIRS